MLMFVYYDCIPLALFHTVMGKTAAAKIRDNVSGLGAFITGNIDDMYNARFVRTSARCLSYSFCNDCAVFIYTASLGRLILWNDISRDAIEFGEDLVTFPCLNRNLSENFIFGFLYPVVK